MECDNTPDHLTFAGESLNKLKHKEPMTSLTFSKELAQRLLDSDEEYPLTLDFAWRCLGYASKQKAKDKLTRNFDRGVDYILNQMVENTAAQGSQTAGRLSEDLRLTVECFKSLGMMAGTEQGKTVRKYFLECEKVAWKAYKESQHQPQVYQLPPVDRRVNDLMNSVAMMDKLLGLNPYMQQQFKDLIGNMLTTENQKSLLGEQTDFRGIVALAEDLGFKVSIKGDKCRTNLGKFIKIAAPHLTNKKEKRLCNETQRPIYVYPLPIPEVKQELTALVYEFFEVAPITKTLPMRQVEYLN